MRRRTRLLLAAAFTAALLPAALDRPMPTQVGNYTPTTGADAAPQPGFLFDRWLASHASRTPGTSRHLADR